MTLGGTLLKLLYMLPLKWYYSKPLMHVRGGLISDVGGGSGLLARLLIEERRARDVVVIDPFLGLLKRGRGVRGVHPVAGVAEKLPLRDGSLDGVVINDALHHFSEPDRALSEAFRVLKCGFPIYIFDFDLASLPVKLLRLLERIMGFPGNFMTLDTLISKLQFTRFKRIYDERGLLGSLAVKAEKIC